MAKIARARGHFVDLERQFRSWNEAERPLAPIRPLPSCMNVLQVARPLGAAPPVMEWSSILGDGIHNLRAGLDGLAWELCHLEGCSPAKPRRVQFPIGTREGAEWRRVERDLASMPAPILERIRALQEWSGEPEAQHSGMLSLLHDLDIADKHQSLVTIQPVPEFVSLDSVSMWPAGLSSDVDW